MTFLSNDCDPDKLMLSLELSGLTGNLCGAPVDEFEMALESLAGVWVMSTFLERIIPLLVKMDILGPRR